MSWVMHLRITGGGGVSWTSLGIVNGMSLAASMVSSFDDVLGREEGCLGKKWLGISLVDCLSRLSCGVSFRVAFGHVFGDLSLGHIFERSFGNVFRSGVRNVVGTCLEMSL